MSDAHNAAAFQEGMMKAAYKLHAMVDEYGLAKQVLAFSSDRKKNLLAKYAAPLLDCGRSQPQAETLARASDEYRAEFEHLCKQDQHAHLIIAKWDAVYCIYEAKRSGLSAQKESMRVLQG